LKEKSERLWFSNSFALFDSPRSREAEGREAAWSSESLLHPPWTAIYKEERKKFVD